MANTKNQGKGKPYTKDTRSNKSDKSNYVKGQGKNRDDLEHVEVNDKENWKGAKRNYKGRDTKYNDPDFYKITDQLIKDVGNIPFNVFSGTFENVFGHALANTGLQNLYMTNDTADCSTPGVMVVRYLPYPGFSDNGASAVNISSKALYTWVRHQNSGHSNYESSDLMIYVLAMAHGYLKYLEAKRIYEVAITYTYENRTIPDVILTALDVDPDNIRANLAQFRYGLNIAAAKLSSMAVPDVFTLFKRYAFLASNIFTDSTTLRSQFYIYSCAGYRVYDPTQYSDGGSLKYVGQSSNRSYTDILTELNNIIDPIIADEDMNIMSGDILKAFGRESLYVLPEVSDLQTASIIFDENALAQIENSFAFGDNTLGCIESYTGRGTYDIWQTAGDIIQCGFKLDYYNAGQYVDIATCGILAGNVYFNSHKDETSPEDIVEWSRCMLGAVDDVNNNKLQLCPGSELILSYRLYRRYFQGSGIAYVNAENFDSVTLINNDNSMMSLLKTISLVDTFDWHPILYYCVGAQSSGTDTVGYLGYFGDMKKYTLIGTEARNKLNDNAVMAELGALLLKQYTKA